MIYYITPYILIVLASILSLRMKGKGYKYLFLLSFIPAVLLVTMRGLVGTDTYSYLSFFEQSKWDIEANYYNLEIGFVAYLKVVTYLGIAPQKALNLFSLIICIVIYFNFSQAKKSFIIFASLIFPVFFYDMTMNGLRYGLAFVLAVPFILEPIKNFSNISKNKILMLLSILNHNSVITFIFFKIFINLNIKNFIVGLVITVVAFYLLQDYLLLKFDNYSELESPGALSGIQPLIIMFLLVVINSVFFKSRTKRNLYLLLLQICFYGLTQFTYGGLRFQFATLFFLMILTIKDTDCKNYNLYITGIYLIGLLGFLLKARNMLDGYGIGYSPFLPYLFYGQ